MQGKNEQSADHTIAVGIDVSKDWLDIALWPINTSFRVANNKKGHKALIRQLAGFDVVQCDRSVFVATCDEMRIA